MAKNNSKVNTNHIFLLVISIFLLHIILAYLIAVTSNYLLVKYNFREEDLFQVNTMSHTFVSIIDVILIGVVLKYFL